MKQKRKIDGLRNFVYIFQGFAKETMTFSYKLDLHLCGPLSHRWLPALVLYPPQIQSYSHSKRILKENLTLMSPSLTLIQWEVENKSFGIKELFSDQDPFLCINQTFKVEAGLFFAAFFFQEVGFVMIITDLDWIRLVMSSWLSNANSTKRNSLFG